MIVWGWLKPVLAAVLEFFWRKRKEPVAIITDAKTPAPIRRRYGAAFREWLRDKQGDHPPK